MDLLGQYQQQNPEPRPESAVTRPSVIPGRETGTMISLVMRLSGGTITNRQQAIYVLLGIAIVFVAGSFFLFFGIPGISSIPTHPNTINP